MLTNVSLHMDSRHLRTNGITPNIAPVGYEPLLHREISIEINIHLCRRYVNLFAVAYYNENTHCNHQQHVCNAQNNSIHKRNDKHNISFYF